MEVLNSSGWQRFGPDLPKSVYIPCLVEINATSILVMAGAINGGVAYSTETYIFNSVTNVWTSGPALNYGRRSMGCGWIKESAQSTKNIFIIAGGENALTSVELLPTVEDVWKIGRAFRF
jgi:hypothetical protein